MGSEERRSDLELRRRIDDLLARVSAAREEIVEAGLDAVHDSRAGDATAGRGRFARSPKSGAGASSASARGSRSDS